MLQTSWASQLNPLLSDPLSNSIMLADIVLKTGDNTINHRLGRKLQGYIVTRMQDGFVQLYDKQNSNQMPELTLILNSSGNGKIDLIVF